MPQQYSREQIYDAMRAADAAGDAEAVRALIAQLEVPVEGGEALHGTVTYEGPNPANQLARATENAVAGAAQGAAGVIDLPLQIGSAVNRGANQLVGQGGGALLDMIGAEGAADWWRQGSDRREATQQGGNATLAGMIEQASPTQEGMGLSRFGAQMVGGLAVPFGPKAPPAPVKAPVSGPISLADEVIRAGEQNNVRVMTTDVRPPTTFLGKVSRSAGERIPFAGTAGPRAAQQNERVEAVKRIAQDYGADAEGLLDDVTADLAKTRGGRLKSLTAAKDRIIDGIEGAVETPRALQTIDDQIGRLQRIGNEKLNGVIAELENFKGVLTSGRSLREIEENRKILGDMFADQNLASVKSVGQKAINSIYAPLRDDMATFIRKNGGEEAFQTWRKSNKELAAMAGELDVRNFKKVISDAETTPENVATLLFSKKPSDVKRLVANISPEGRRKAQSAILHRAIEKAGGIDNISPDRFANEVGRLGNSVGIVFEGSELASLKGLERLLQSTKQASVASVAPPTGVQNTPIVGGFAAGSWLGAGAIPWAAAAGGLARLYESAPVRNMLVALRRTQPGSKAESNLLEKIGKVAASQTNIQSENVARAANSNVPVPLAADEGQENQREQ